MNTPSKPKNLEEVLDRIGQVEQNDAHEITVRDVMSELGRRSFAPVLLVPGILTVIPVIGGIPGVPTVMAVLVLLVAGQVLFGRHYFWLPNWILKRSVKPQKIDKTMKWARPPARFVDRFLRKRLSTLTDGAGVHAIAVVCIAIALMMPPMELVPFTATGAGLALILFGLALMAHDGVVAIIAFIFTLVTFGLVFYGLV